MRMNLLDKTIKHLWEVVHKIFIAFLCVANVPGWSKNNFFGIYWLWQNASQVCFSNNNFKSGCKDEPASKKSRKNCQTIAKNLQQCRCDISAISLQFLSIFKVIYHEYIAQTPSIQSISVWVIHVRLGLVSWKSTALCHTIKLFSSFQKNSLMVDLYKKQKNTTTMEYMNI